MKIAFIEPAIMRVEPLGIGYLAQVLINNGHQVKYFEAPRPYFLNRLKSFHPQVLAYSIATGKHRLAQQLNATIRKQINALSVFGGPYCTFYPEFIETDELIDGACRGEGEEALVELLNRIEHKQDYTQTANWWLRVNGKIYKNQIRPKIANLDQLPFPSRELIYAENDDLRQMPIKRILGSRGCPFDCSYCFNKKYNAIYQDRGRVYRQRSVQNIIQEIKEIRRNYPCTFLRFVEDIFGLEIDYDNFAQVYREEVNLPFLCYSRANLIDEYKVRKLKEAGCVAIAMAIESGNDFIRNKILNRSLSQEELERAIITIKRAGIRLWTQNIIANPQETFSMALETLNLNIKHRVDFAECSLLMPYPGTDIYQYCLKNNYFQQQQEGWPKSFWLDSSIRFDSNSEKRKLVNLQKFFSFTVQHPIVLPIVKVLIKVPPNDLYIFFSRIYDAWKISRIVRAKFNLRNFITTVRSNIRYILTYILKKDTGDLKPSV